MEKAILGRSRVLAGDEKGYYRKSRSSASEVSNFFRRQILQRTQYFTVRAEEDNRIRGRGGVEIDIPALSFTDPFFGGPVFGKVTVELVELLTTADMLLTDRPTTSGPELLETGGAFRFSATRDRRPLSLNNPVAARVPVTPRTGRPDLMTAFIGSLSPAGRFDWNLSTRDRIVNAQSSGQEGFYELEVNRPAWINCDHFYRMAKYRNAKFKNITAVPDQVFDHNQTFILFRDINSVACMWPDRNGRAFFRAPEGHEATLVTLAGEGRELFFGTRDINTAEGADFSVPVDRVEGAEIPERVQAILNR